MPAVADRVFQLGSETALDVLVRAKELEAEGRRVLHLEVGEPDFPTPMHIVEAGVRALREGRTRYGPPAGLPELRAAIADELAGRGVNAAIEHLLVAPGAKPLVFYGKSLGIPDATISVKAAPALTTATRNRMSQS